MENQIQEIVKRIEVLPWTKNVDQGILTRLKYQLLDRQRLTEDEKEMLINHPELILTNTAYDIVETNKMSYWVYIKNDPIARFFSQDKAVEYVLFLMNLI